MTARRPDTDLAGLRIAQGQAEDEPGTAGAAVELVERHHVLPPWLTGA
jgi:hypothetical protein